MLTRKECSKNKGGISKEHKSQYEGALVPFSRDIYRNQNLDPVFCATEGHGFLAISEDRVRK